MENESSTPHPQSPVANPASDLKRAELSAEIQKRNWESQKLLFAALSKAQGAMSSAGKDGNNPHFKSKYSTLADVRDAIQEPLANNGLCFYHDMDQDLQSKTLTVTCHVCHLGGGEIKCSLMAGLPDLSPQKVGSAETYLRRYTLLAILGVASDDDDGEAAQGRSNDNAQPVRKTAPKAHKQAPVDDPLEMPDGWTAGNWNIYCAVRACFKDETKKEAIKAINKEFKIAQWDEYRGLKKEIIEAIAERLQEMLK